MLKSLKLFKLFAKFDLTMCWTGSAQARHGSGGVPGEEYITFKTFVSTTVPMIAAKAFGAKTTTTMTPTGTSTTAAGGMGRQKPARAVLRAYFGGNTRWRTTETAAPLLECPPPESLVFP